MSKEQKPYQELYNSLFHYHSPVNVYNDKLQRVKGKFATPGHCHLQVTQSEQLAIVIATEVATNQGQSVTNAIDLIATLAVNQFRLDPARTRFIEHYTPESYEGAEQVETFALVEFTWREREASNPQWRPMKPEELAGFGIL